MHVMYMLHMLEFPHVNIFVSRDGTTLDVPVVTASNIVGTPCKVVTPPRGSQAKPHSLFVSLSLLICIYTYYISNSLFLFSRHIKASLETIIRKDIITK